MNKNNINKLMIFSIFVCLFNNIQSTDDHVFPKTLTFYNDTGETITISSPTNQEIAPGESFLLSDDNHKTPHVRWHILKNINSGIYISAGVFIYQRNILTIVEKYAENPQGSHSVLKSFKKIIPLSSTSENFTLFKNGRLVDIEPKI